MGRTEDDKEEKSENEIGKTPDFKIILSVVALLILVVGTVFGKGKLVPQTPDVTTEKTTQTTTEHVLSTEVIELSGEDDTQNRTESAEESVTEEKTESATESVTEETTEPAAELTFRNKKLLEQHYDKHGVDMGFASAKEYEAAAAAVVNNPKALHKTEKEDGDDVYYVESTNEFVIVSTDGYIRTYFLPSGGIDYYNRQ